LSTDDAVTPLARQLKLFYFLYFVTVGVYYPFFVPYLRGLGFDGEAIGTAQMALAIASVPGAILWGAIADRLGAPSRALIWAARGAAVMAALLVWARTPREVTLILLAQGFVAPAIVPLLDTVTVESVRSRVGASYGRIRLWGSLAFIAAAQALGLLLAARGDRPGDVAVPVLYACAFAVFAIVVSAAPPPVLPAGSKPRLAEMWALLADRRLLFLLAAAALHAGTTACYQFFGVLVRDEGLSATVTGAGMAFGVAAEVVVLFAFPLLERRLSLKALLAIAFAGTSLRWLLLSRAHGAPPLVALQGMHGLTFGLYWAAAIRMVERLVPSHLRATGQALFTAVTLALGGAIGYRLAGFGYDRFGGAPRIFAWAALVELVPLTLVPALAPRSHRRLV